MSVPNVRLVCQAIIAAALIVSAAVWFSSPRYAFMQGASGTLRLNVHDGSAVTCLETQQGLQCP